jgi:DNA modification methylase
MTAETHSEKFTLYNADCIDFLRAVPENSIHFSVFSPPYMSLYIYSAHPRDIGNCQSDAEFWQHFGYVIDELFRVMRKGRIVSVDCAQVPSMKERDGVIGLKDFRGDIIRAFQARGFIYSSEHCCWKDPLLEATRTKAHGLMHLQLCKDSTMSRAGLPQYLLGFRKPGANENPVTHPEGLTRFFGLQPPSEMAANPSHERWRRYASPVWDDIDFTDTLNTKAARENEDERHVCPMALDMIRRAIELWSSEGETVLDPFSGVGSTGYCALQMGRLFLGSELKASYYEQAVKNLREAENTKQGELFSLEGT